MKYFWMILLFCSIGDMLHGQSQIASPRIFNYTAQQYKGGIQNWEMAQDKNGLLYVGNKEGLLTFNGRYWNRYPLPNYTGIRSVKVDSKNRIYVGGQDELGYFFPDRSGVLRYHSLLHLLPAAERKMADIWNIVIINDDVFFRSLSSIIHYKQGVVDIYKPEVTWDYLGITHGRLFAQSRSRGILCFENGVWKPFADDPILRQTAITSILSYNKDTLLISTLKKGLFHVTEGKLSRKKTAIDQQLLNDRLFCGANVNGNWLAFGTSSSGLFILDKKGNVVQKFSLNEGLQNDNIRSIYVDHNGSMWLGLDDGIDMVAINSAIKYIYPNKNKQVSYSVRVFNNALYVASSNGLFYTALQKGLSDLSLNKGPFYEVHNTSGQVWNLEELNGHLVVGHEDGLFTIDKGDTRHIYQQPGTWMFQPVSHIFPSEKILAGTYHGLQLIGYSNGQFKNAGPLKGINESLRFIVYDRSSNIVWASHPYHGVYKLQLSADLTKVTEQTIYTEADGLPATLYNYVYRIHNRVVIATEKGIYEYSAARNRFFPSAFFSPFFNDLPVLYLKEDNEGNVWFVTNRKEVGVVEISEDKKGLVTYFPEIKEKIVGGFESIYPYDSENIFIGAAKGVFHINYKKFKERQNSLSVVLGEVRLLGEQDTILYGGYFLRDSAVVQSQDKEQLQHLDYDQNFLHFEFASTLYNELNNIEYSYFLEGLDKTWSAWSDKSEKDYTSLPPGNYTFKVKARNNAGNESEQVSYSFTIAPVWYRTIWSYIMYTILLVYAIFILLKRQKKKHKREHEKLSYLHQLELDRTEKEIIRLKNDKLESEVEFKNRELANMTMHLVQRGKVIEKIKVELASASNGNDAVANSNNFKRLLRLIKEVEKGEKDWEQFNHHFNNVHADFFKHLQRSFPDLTSNELKLCAFIKMNLSSKEIAQLMNITIKAVEVGRYRLRKKLALHTDTNLHSFLVQISD